LLLISKRHRIKCLLIKCRKTHSTAPSIQLQIQPNIDKWNDLDSFIASVVGVNDDVNHRHLSHMQYRSRSSNSLANANSLASNI
jgi:hypothetical protein